MPITDRVLNAQFYLFLENVSICIHCIILVSFNILSHIVHVYLTWFCSRFLIHTVLHIASVQFFIQWILQIYLNIATIIISKWFVLYATVKGHFIFSLFLPLCLSHAHPNTYLCLPWPELWAVSIATFTTLGDGDSQLAVICSCLSPTFTDCVLISHSPFSVVLSHHHSPENL